MCGASYLVPIVGSAGSDVFWPLLCWLQLREPEWLGGIWGVFGSPGLLNGQRHHRNGGGVMRRPTALCSLSSGHQQPFKGLSWAAWAARAVLAAALRGLSTAIRILTG